MIEFRTKLSENGRIIIPASCRQLLHLKPGEELIIRVEDDEMTISTAKQALKKVQHLVRKHAKNKSLVKKLKTIRRADTEIEVIR